MRFPVATRRRIPAGGAAACLFAGLAAATGGRLEADTFRLVSGGEIQGEWTNAQVAVPEHYVVRTAAGAEVRLAADQVAEHIRRDPGDERYQRLASRYADSPADQWRLAEALREGGLTRRRQETLERIIQIDPDHAQARWALGYAEVGGQWVRSRQWRRDNGYVYYDGKWRLKQEADLMQERKEEDEAERQWAANLARWREELLAAETAFAARQKFAEVTDHRAVGPLSRMLATEPLPRLRILYVQTLANIKNESASQALLLMSLGHIDSEVRATALDEIVRRRPANAVDVYVNHLKDANNARVNIAAAALMRLGDPGAISPLIEALVTTHTIVLPAAGPPDTVTTSFSPDAPGGPTPEIPRTGTEMRHGGRPVAIHRKAFNQDVLTALVTLSGGVNFSFDQEQWRKWREATQR